MTPHRPRRRNRLLFLALSTGWAMQACVNPKALPLADATSATCDENISSADKTRLAAIDQMIGEGKVYAALAQIEALNSRAPLVRLTQAEALRRTETPDQARPIYASLLDSCYKGRAHHGLGLLAARQGDNASSLSHLREARLLLPTDPRVRNDLGFALLLADRLPEARFEFMTALDLDPQDPRAARNLILLTLKQGDPDRAQEMATRLGLDKATMDKLVKQASELTPLPAPSSPASAVSSPTS